MNSTSDKAQNLSQAFGLLVQAVDQGCELIAYPETFNLLTDSGREMHEGAETLKGPTVESLREWAIEHEIWIHSGSLLLKSGQKKSSRLTNTSLLINPDGEIVARYDKIHLFDVELSRDRKYHESKHIQPGHPGRAVIAETPFGKAGLSICYDLRFPELYRKFAAKKVSLIFIPAAFTALTGKAHWDVLTRARAVENQAYVIAAAQTGSPYPGRQVYGHSRIIDPWGRILAERPKGVGLVWADLNRGELDRIRRELPALEHRRLK